VALQEARMPTPTNQIGDPGLSQRAQAPTFVDRAEPRYFESELRMMPGLTIPIRSLLVEANGDRVLISPVGTGEEHAAIGDQLTTLVAPTLLHHKFLGTAIHRYQPTALWAPPGFTEKHPDYAPVRVFGADPWPYTGVLDYALLEGSPRTNDVLFFHRPSRTLYSADLFFNIREPQGVLAPVLLRLQGVYKRFAVIRARKQWATDRDAFRRSLDRVFAWDFDRLVLGHGDVIDRDARAVALRALHDVGLYG
jgi:hypothetical protein